MSTDANINVDAASYCCDAYDEEIYADQAAGEGYVYTVAAPVIMLYYMDTYNDCYEDILDEYIPPQLQC